MDTIFPYQPAMIAKDYSQRIHSGVFFLKNSDAESVLEFLYMAYADVPGWNPKEIDQGFLDLATHLSKFSLDENNETFGIVCKLCDTYEKRACMDAIQIGVYLMMELHPQ